MQAFFDEQVRETIKVTIYFVSLLWMLLFWSQIWIFSLFGYFFIQLHLGFLFFLLDKTIVFFLLDFCVRKGGLVVSSPPLLKQGDTFETLYM